MRRSWRVRPSLWAVIIIGVIVIGQFFLLDHLVTANASAAHVIDLSGSQRMRTQRIAFLVELIHAEGVTPAREAELKDVSDQVLTVRADLLKHADENGGITTFDTAYGLGPRVNGFVHEVRLFLKNPRDDAAYRAILAQRLDLLSHIDSAVHGRAAYSVASYHLLVIALVASLLATLATLAFVFVKIVLPAERNLEATVARAMRTGDQRASLLIENPNAVGFFDPAGVAVQGNAASLELLGREGSLIGVKLSDLVHRYALPAAMEAFRSALNGTPSTFDSVLVDVKGSEIDVEVTAFPNVSNGAIVGVIAVAKDIRAVKAVDRQMREHSERMTELYRIASTSGRTYEQQLEDTLTLVAARLGYEWAILSEISDDVVTPLSLVGKPMNVAIGQRVALDRSLSRYAYASGDIWSTEDLSRSPQAADFLPETTGFTSPTGEPIRVEHHAIRWGALAVAPVRTGDRVFGTLSVGSHSPRFERLAADDAEFLRAVAALVGLVVERRKQERRLDTLAYFDNLTGLPNRTALMDRLSATAESALRTGKEYALLYLDLDRFKQINDVFGHAVGDEVLRLAGSRMQKCVRPEDTVSRIGGDEFIILIPTPYGRSGAVDLAERVLASMKKPFIVDGTAHIIGISIGIALSPMNGRDATELMKAADEALYRAKRAGRNQMEFAA